MGYRLLGVGKFVPITVSRRDSAPPLGRAASAGCGYFALDYDAILAAMYALTVSAEGDCYLYMPPDPGIEAAALGARESALSLTAPAEALHTFTLDSGASRCFFRNSTTAVTPLPARVAARLADPSGGPVLARSSTVLPCPAVPSGSLSGLHHFSFSTSLVSTAALQDAMVTTTTPRGSGPTPSGVSQVDPVEPIEEAVDSATAGGGAAEGGAARGAASGGAEPERAEPGVVELEVAEFEGAEPEGGEPEHAEPGGAEPGGAGPAAAGPGGARATGLEGPRTRGIGVRGAGGTRGAGAGGTGSAGAAGAGGSGGAGATSPGAAGGARVAGPRGARTGGTGASGGGGAAGVGAGDPGVRDPGAGGAGAGGARAVINGAGGSVRL
ncbi:unnamed protein product [Closterium sp. NIES-54]